MSTRVRPAAFAGYFYPGRADTLRGTVAVLIGDVPAPDDRHPSPKAIIAPHAGYQYSGSIAACAHATLAPARGTVRRILLAGPAHRVPVPGVALPGVDAFATPLGPVEIDDEARRDALAVEGVEIDDRAHADEHSLEVQLPFLLEVLGDVAVLPMLVRDPGVPALTRVLDLLWGGDETRVVVSTDLSHYDDQAAAEALDGDTATAIVERYEVPGVDRACGAAATTALLTVARRRGLSARLIRRGTSADTAGDPTRVVGYGAFALS